MCASSVRALGGDDVTTALLHRAVDCRVRMGSVLEDVAAVVNRLHEFEDARPWQGLPPQARREWALCWRRVKVATGKETTTAAVAVACQPQASAEASPPHDPWGPLPDQTTVTAWLQTLERGTAMYRDLDRCRTLPGTGPDTRNALDAEYEALEDLAGRLEHALAAEECAVATVKAQVCLGQ